MPNACVIFDFDGVIADTESLHHAAYNHAFAAHAADIGGPLEIPRQAYFTRYIVYGDQEGFFHMLRDHGRPADDSLIRRLSATKHDLFQDKLGAFAEPLPGVREILAFLESQNVPRAICSGARRAEIIELLDAFQLRRHFNTVVAIEDVRNGKPDPEGYNKAFDLLNIENDATLEKEHSLVIEDSEGGCAAARAAGLPVLAVATSLPLEHVRRCATHAAENLTHITPAQLTHWLRL